MGPMRRILLLLLAGCAAPRAPEPGPDPRERALDRFEAAAAGLERFRAWYELRDESTGQSVLLELALAGPDTAKIALQGSHLLLFRDGVCRFQTESYGYQVPWRDELQKARERHEPAFRAADEALGAPAPRRARLAFDLAGWEGLNALRGLRPQLAYSAGPSRFGWLRTLRDPSFVFDGKNTFRREGDGITRPAVEAAVDERGFLSRVRIVPPPPPGRTSHPGFTLELKSLSTDAMADDVFAPPKGPVLDRTAQASQTLRGAIGELIARMLVEPLAARYGRRWEQAPQAAVARIFVEYFRVDLERTCDPAGRLAVVRENQKKELETAREQIEQSADRETIRKFFLEKMRIRKNVHLAQVDEIEEALQAAYRHAFADLLLYDSRTSREFRAGIVAAAAGGLSLALREALRDPVEKIFDQHLSALEKEP